jgi:hypothetical protein
LMIRLIVETFFGLALQSGSALRLRLRIYGVSVANQVVRFW